MPSTSCPSAPAKSLPSPPTATPTCRRNHNGRGRCLLYMTRAFGPSSQSSISIAPSTAKGQAIPVDEATAQYRTLSLRQLNSHYPSRHRYAKSTGAKSSTYSEPVIVRSYYTPTPSRRGHGDRHSNSSRRRTVRGAGSDVGTVQPFSFCRKEPSAGTGMQGAMARGHSKRMPAREAQQDIKLPPIEAFSFRSFMTSMQPQPQPGMGDINSDLDRIAEICARSRYSLSDQYEVHYAPHGSGTAFFITSTQGQEPHGPTLQAVSYDDEPLVRSSTRRRGNAGRAVGTLETIMSSSRSSEEDSCKKGSALDLAKEVRGRAATKVSAASSTPMESHLGPPEHVHSTQAEQQRQRHRKRSSMSLALIESARQAGVSADKVPRASSAALMGAPALPQETGSQSRDIRQRGMTPMFHIQTSAGGRKSN